MSLKLGIAGAFPWPHGRDEVGDVSSGFFSFILTSCFSRIGFDALIISTRISNPLPAA